MAWGNSGGGGCQPAVAANVPIRRSAHRKGDDEDVIATEREDALGTAGRLPPLRAGCVIKSPARKESIHARRNFPGSVG
jgi:hypothetical protein